MTFLKSPPIGVEYEPKALTDKEMDQTIPCYCDGCGTELRIHPLFPIVGGLSLEHACVAKRPVIFERTVIEVKPMGQPNFSQSFSTYFNFGEFKKDKK